MHDVFPATGDGTCLLMRGAVGAGLPEVLWLGVRDDGAVLAAPEPSPGTPLLVEHSRGAFVHPGLVGHRLGRVDGGARDVAGRDWSTRFVTAAVEDSGDRLVVRAVDAAARLELVTEVEVLPGGALRARHRLTNTGSEPFLVDALELAVPLPDDATELLDLTGRHEMERSPQRHQVADGRWVRESRRGKPGLDAASYLVAGTPGFSFGAGRVVLVSVAHSGGSRMAVQRDSGSSAVLTAGELLLPGEVVLLAGQSYEMPWVVVTAGEGLDDVAAALHTWQRSLAAHPVEQPVTLNVWEAVFFDHDRERLAEIASRAAAVGVERFVLDDGWFPGRRDDTAGLGDWWVDPEVWPDGLTPLVEHVHRLGMQFGLWFEPEMVNPRSQLFEGHPEWILATGGREPLMHRHQHVLDLTHPGAFAHVLEQVSAVLAENAVDYVKWDHNRDLLEAGSAHHDGAPAVHAQDLAYTALLDELRRRHPAVAWESCAAGGGRIDLGVVERVQRFWTSDGTDALGRQGIQRWTVQMIAPEYLGAHVASATSHMTGRTFGLDFRCATAFFGAFGIECDLTLLDDAELEALGTWVALHRQHRPLLHSGRTVRLDVADPAVLAHGVVSPDGDEALLAHVQLAESTHNRGVVLRVPGLQDDVVYAVDWLGPGDHAGVSASSPLDPAGPTGGRRVTGAALRRVGIWLPRRRPESALLLHVHR